MGQIIVLPDKDKLKSVASGILARSGPVPAARYVGLTVFRGVKDKAGNPYARHLAAVANAVRGKVKKSVGWMHDAIEDSDLTPGDIADIDFGKKILRGVAAVTKNPGEMYLDFIVRCGLTPEYIPVKLADLQHNGDPFRLPMPLDAEDHDRIEKYWLSQKYLTAVLKKEIRPGTPVTAWFNEKARRENWPHEYRMLGLDIIGRHSQDDGDFDRNILAL